MPEVLAASLAFPTVIFTVVLALALIYWLFVILGALDLDLLGGADGHVPDLDGVTKGVLEGATKGVLEGATKGALEGATKGVLEGAAKGAAEGIADAGADGADDGGLAALFASLELSRAPATVVLTLLAAFAWLLSVLAMMTAAPYWAAWGLPRWLLGAPVLVASLILALPLTSIAVRPLGPLFATRAAQSRKDLVGRVCVISTGRVDARFGQAKLEDGGAGLILDVRCEDAGALRQGDRALLVSWDPEHEVFNVEPLDALLSERARLPRPEGGARAPSDERSDDAAPDPSEGAAKARARDRAP